MSPGRSVTVSGTLRLLAVAAIGPWRDLLVRRLERFDEVARGHAGR